MPKGEGERDPFEYSPEWARQMFARMLTALDARAASGTALNAASTRESRLYVLPRGVDLESLGEGAVPAGIISAQEHPSVKHLSSDSRSGIAGYCDSL